jgi:hypothetical protein
LRSRLKPAGGVWEKSRDHRVNAVAKEGGGAAERGGKKMAVKINRQ